MLKEEWKSIKGYENRYQVSNHGRVKSLARIIEADDGFERHYREKYLKLKPNKARGYVAVRLYDDEGNYKHIEVHRLVALHFLSNLDGFPIVNHIDQVRDNNHVDNLEWCTYAHNLLHKGAHRRSREKIKKKVFQYSLDGEFVRAWSSATDCAREMEIERSGISHVCNGHRLHHAGFVWKFE